MALWSCGSTEITHHFLCSGLLTHPSASLAHPSISSSVSAPSKSSMSPHLHPPLLLRGHRLGFSSRGQELDQAPWGWSFHLCSPVEEHSGKQQDIKVKLAYSTIDNCYMFLMIMLIVGIQRMMALPPRLFLFLYPHLFHLGLTDRIKSHLKSPIKISLE